MVPPQSYLGAAELAAIALAFYADPALPEELALIEPWLEPRARARFWREFAIASGECERPGAAVLVALERAAAIPGPGEGEE